jgi:hypothetical protein
LSSGEYLIDLDDREKVALHRLIAYPSYIGNVLMSFGLHPCFSWYLFDVDKGLLDERLLNRGDIDILAGNLEWANPEAYDHILMETSQKMPGIHPSHVHYCASMRMVATVGFRWPPSTVHLVAIEAKCAHYDAEKDEVKGRHDSSGKKQHLRAQVDSLIRMAFDRIGLLDVIATPPSYSEQSGVAWSIASGWGGRAYDLLKPMLLDRLPQEWQVGHWVLPIGAVAGGDESMQGSLMKVQLRPRPGAVEDSGDDYSGPFRAIPTNPFLCGGAIKECRNGIERRLTELLASLHRPTSFPAKYRACHCKSFHYGETPCPDIGIKEYR